MSDEQYDPFIENLRVSSGAFYPESTINTTNNTNTDAGSKTNSACVVEPSQTSLQASIHDNLARLTATIGAAEQDGSLDQRVQKKLVMSLRAVELSFDGRHPQEISDDTDELTADQSLGDDEDDEDLNRDQDQLQEIRNNLAATVSSMRLRQEEQRHLHLLSMQRLEAVAQTCVVQEDQIRDLVREVQELRKENWKLGEENNDLRDHVEMLASEMEQREVAVRAMSSAVTGLEGWVNHAQVQNRYEKEFPQAKSKVRRPVVRGRGRFRGKYYIDEDDIGMISHGLDGGNDMKDWPDGIRAWLRGFRDVEEELNKTASNRSSIKSRGGRNEVSSIDEEWGDFETVSE